MINYYRDMWQNRSHVLAPPTGLVIPLVKYKWGEELQKTFDEIKQKVSKEKIIAFSIQQTVGSSHYTGRKTAGFI
jgi:hypothetical protein